MWNQVGLAALLAPSFYLATRVADGKVVGALGWALGCAVLAGGLAVVLIPNMASYTLRKGLAGRDLGKKDRETRNPTYAAKDTVGEGGRRAWGRVGGFADTWSRASSGPTRSLVGSARADRRRSGLCAAWCS